MCHRHQRNRFRRLSTCHWGTRPTRLCRPHPRRTPCGTSASIAFHPTFVAIATRPSIGMECDQYSSFTKIVTAADWHDGQFVHGAYARLSLGASSKSVIALVSRARRSVKRCSADPRPTRIFANNDRPRISSAPQARCAASGAREWSPTPPRSAAARAAGLRGRRQAARGAPWCR